MALLGVIVTPVAGGGGGGFPLLLFMPLQETRNGSVAILRARKMVRRILALVLGWDS
jgi:hypothetical protein